MATADPVYDPALTGGGVTLSQGTLAGRGSTSGTGTEEAITLGAGLALTGTVLDTTGSGSGGAATNEPFVTIGHTAGLSAERALTASTRVTVTDGGANGAVTLDLGTASVADSYLADMTARSLKGRSANSTGVPGTISGAGAGTYASDDASTVAFRAVTDIIQNLNLSGDLSPAQITASQNDYNPTSLSTASILRLDLDAARSITGIAGGADGRFLGIFNISAFVLTLTDASASSSAANRFDFNGDLALGSKHGVVLWYDSTSSRWRLLSRAFPFTAVPTTRTLTAGAGLTGTGDLSADRTFAVGANADGTITVNADDIQVGTLIAANIPSALVTDAKLANMGALAVKGRSANSSGVPADIAATAATDAVLRESGSVIGFGTIVAGGIASNAVTTAKILDANVTDAKLADMAARTLKGRSANSTGVPGSIAGGGAGTYLNDSGTALAFTSITDITQNLNISGDISPTQITATQNDYSPTGLSTASVLRLNTDASRNVTGLTGGVDGRLILIVNTGGFGLVLSDESASSTAANRFSLGADRPIAAKEGFVLWYDSTSSRWRPVSQAPGAGGGGAPTTATYITISSDGTLSAERVATATSTISVTDGTTTVTWDVIDGSITNAKLRNSGALSVVGRSANSTGVPADISATAATDSVLRESGSTIGFGTIATAGIANSAVTYAKIANAGALAVVGRSANSTGVVADIQATAATDSVLRESGSTIGFGTIVAGGIASNAVTTAKILDANVTYAKIANAGARSVVGRSANSSGVVADISGGGAGQVLVDNGTTVGFAFLPPTVATLADAATVVVDAALIAHGGSFDLTISGNRTMGAPSNAVNGKVITFAIRQNAGSNTMAWNAIYRWTTSVTLPTLSTGAGKTDYVAFRYNGTDTKWDAMAVNLAA